MRMAARSERSRRRSIASGTSRIEMVDNDFSGSEGRTGPKRMLAIEGPPGPAALSARRTSMAERSERNEPPSYESVMRGSNHARRPKSDVERAYRPNSRSTSWPWLAERSKAVYDGARKDRSAVPVSKSTRRRHHIEGLEDSKTVVPSDSVSCVGSRSRRSSRSSSLMRRELGALDRGDERDRWTLPVRSRDREYIGRRRVARYVD